MFRLLAIFVALALLVALPFLLWGDALESAFGSEGATRQLRRWGDWAWAAGFLLVVSDIVLPIPATAVMAALGIVYGPLLGGLISALGSITAGTIGYLAFRAIGPAAAERLAGREGLEAARRLFLHWCGWIVAGSRWMPILPETIAGLAGLAGMPFARFLAALACGALPMGLAAASIGHYGAEAPFLAMTVSALIPLALWPLAHRLVGTAPRA
jgi:uncharacterized membrane protein YdjX (TVP38/TMEM64 family)